MSTADSKGHPLSSHVGDDGQPAEASLVERLRTGDADAFAEIVRAWSPMMLHVARMYVSTDASAQEVVQEAWLAMIQGLDKFEGRSSLRTWMLAILGNIGRSRGVREARTVPLSSLGSGEDDGPAVDPDRFRGPDDKWPRNWTPLGKPRPWPRSPEEEMMAAESRTQLENGLAELPERQRTVVTLRDVHGLSSDEVSSFLGLSAGNQRVLLHRGRSRLRGLLEMHYAAGEPVMGHERRAAHAGYDGPLPGDVELVTDYLEGVLDPDMTAEVEAHLQLCDGCDTYVEQIRATVHALGKVPVESLSEEAQAELVRAFRDMHGPTTKH